MIEARSIDHICLWVNSLSEAKEYYEKLFGFVCTPRKNDQSTLCVESDSVHFFMSEKTENKAFLPEQHLSFEVESLGKVTASLETLGILDYKIGEVHLFKKRNYKWCEWRDPSGIRLECVEII